MIEQITFYPAGLAMRKGPPNNSSRRPPFGEAPDLSYAGG